MSINTNYSLPANQTAGTSGTSNSPNASGDNTKSGLDSTFMSLLLAELQCQDPTAPMDTTAMVGQMVSLNQLNELISIQSILQNSLGSATTASNTNNNQSTNGVN